MDKLSFKEALNNEHSDLDVFEPSAAHQMRFLEKLDQGSTTNLKKRPRSWSHISAIAASVILLLGLSVFIFKAEITNKSHLAAVSTEMKDTENFFQNAIRFQLEKIENNSSAETKKIVEDGMLQLKKLELNYIKLEKDLLQSNNNPKVISAMIANFQKRINLLEAILVKIEAHSLQKNTIDETYL